jgi:hypothetical protein
MEKGRKRRGRKTGKALDIAAASFVIYRHDRLEFAHDGRAFARIQLAQGFTGPTFFSVSENTVDVTATALTDIFHYRIESPVSHIPPPVWDNTHHYNAGQNIRK